MREQNASALILINTKQSRLCSEHLQPDCQRRSYNLTVYVNCVLWMANAMGKLIWERGRAPSVMVLGRQYCDGLEHAVNRSTVCKLINGKINTAAHACVQLVFWINKVDVEFVFPSKSANPPKFWQKSTSFWMCNYLLYNSVKKDCLDHWDCMHNRALTSVCNILTADEPRPCIICKWLG